jgi:hypothetical protein
MSIDIIDFDSLKGYSGKTTRSFEQLVYSLMNSKYGHLGKFTAIDGSGGDGGIEFYLDLHTGERWGWQCKFFGGNGRLNISNRKKAISDSLVTSCHNNKILTKWFLCLKTNMTGSLTTKGGAIKPGERDWFENVLPSFIPLNNNVQLDFLGEDELISLIGEIGNLGIRNFFFGQLEFVHEWFVKRFDEHFYQVRDKYIPELHTMDDFHQSIIDYTLLSSNYDLFLTTRIRELEEIERAVNGELNHFNELSGQNDNERHYLAKCRKFFDEFFQYASNTYSALNQISVLISNYQQHELKNMDWETIHSSNNVYLASLLSLLDTGSDSHKRLGKLVYYEMRAFIRHFENFLRNYVHPLTFQLHFFADPAEGKTHLSCEIAFKRISGEMPAIFLTGSKFNNENILEDAILKLLDIPRAYSFEQFLQALDIYGDTLKVKIPFIIDGLNETIHGKLLSPIWRTHLPALITKISATRNVVLITTCRNSYRDEIWGDHDNSSFYFLRGFDGYEVTKIAISRYFQRYHIKADLNFSNLDRFYKPIFLKLYCEIKNPSWGNGIEVEVNIDSDNSDDLFEMYFKKINDTVVSKVHFLRKNESFITTSLAIIARYLWEHDTREIPLDIYYRLLDGDSYNAEISKADLLINEGLLITRDFRLTGEHISITYELMSGYLIARYLVSSLTVNDFKPRGEFHNKIGLEGEGHPLCENIIGELALLFPKYKEKMLHDLYTKNDDRYIVSQSLASLWLLSPIYIRSIDIDRIRSLFSSSESGRKSIIHFCTSTINHTSHPFNADFLGAELMGLSVAERDLSWSEYIRKKEHVLKQYIQEFVDQIMDPQHISELLVQKLNLAAKYISWLLTSTDINLRDLATRGLWHYGRRFPDKYLEICITSINCNDPYVWERTLAALYGICMAEHMQEDFHQGVLQTIGRSVFDTIFSECSFFKTTHLMARDYARGIVRVALFHNPDLLSSREHVLLFPPYRTLTEIPSAIAEQEHQIFKKPLGMDFSNYSIGYIVKNGHGYNNPPEKQLVRRQILFRITQLGWTDELFDEIDRDLVPHHLDRSDRPKIERYGKKYSRIALYEMAGYHDDLGILPKEHTHYRVSYADIDPSFPREVSSAPTFTTDLLGDRNIPLLEWLENGDFPPVEKYLKHSFNNYDEFICLDAFIKQEDKASRRESFVFIRSFLVFENNYAELMSLIKHQPLENRWLPEKRDNYEAYSGEIYLFDEATYDNYSEFSFLLSEEKKMVKRGEEGYHPKYIFKDGTVNFKIQYPKQIEATIKHTKEFRTLMPVMTYLGSWDNKEINPGGAINMISREIALELDLQPKAQFPDLFDSDGKCASRTIEFLDGTTNRHSLVFLRRDLLEEYMSRKGLRMIWAVWGEREPPLSTRRSYDDNDDTQFSKFFTFDKIIEYN